MRVSQQMLFSHYVNNMNNSLSDLLELNLQSQTQKVINRPSDDPVGMERILDFRDSLRQLDQYEENISTGKGWLGRSDDTLMQVSTLITRAKELAEQAASGTYSADNREQISYELRSLFDQMVEMSNMEYEDKSIYAGHKVNGNAFERILWMTTNDADLAAGTDFRIQGNADTTVLVQFYDTSGTALPGEDVTFASGNVGVRYSTDGGKTFQTDGTVSGIVNGEVEVQLPQSGASVTFTGVDGTTAVKANHYSETEEADGTWLWLRPSARYVGDDEDAISVDKLGSGVEDLSVAASGSFNSPSAMVRIDNTSDVAMNEEIEYSYSLDGGVSWTTGMLARADSTSNQALINIPPSGLLTINSNGSNIIQAGAQFIVRPRTSDIDVDISVSETVTLNDVGKDIFGGIYQDPDLVLANNGARLPLSSSNASAMFGASEVYLASNASYHQNLFETMGNLIAFLETNNQTGIQQALVNLDESQQQIMKATASVGAREHRLQVAEDLVGNLKLNEQERLSEVEDADVAELMTKLQQQQIVYEAVLRSTSMIMNLNLLKFV